MNILRCSKKQNYRFPSKIALCVKKVYYKVSLCENCQRQSCKAFIGLSIRAKMIGWNVPFYVKIWQILTNPLAKCRLAIYFCSQHLSRDSQFHKVDKSGQIWLWPLTLRAKTYDSAQICVTVTVTEALIQLCPYTRRPRAYHSQSVSWCP